MDQLSIHANQTRGWAAQRNLAGFGCVRVASNAISLMDTFQGSKLKFGVDEERPAHFAEKVFPQQSGDADLDRFKTYLYKVDQHIYRGSKPPCKEILDFLKKDDLHIDTIVSLEPMEPSLVNYAREKGIEVFEFPMFWFESNTKKINDCLNLLHQKAQQEKNCYVHCLLGLERTSHLIAYYRVLHQEWKPFTAVSEMSTIIGIYPYVPIDTFMRMVNRICEDGSRNKNRFGI